MDLAVGVLNLLDKSCDDEGSSDYLSNEIDMFGYNTLEVALVGSCHKFVSSTCVQNYLTKTWHGELSNKHNYFSSFKVLFFSKLKSFIIEIETFINYRSY